MSWLLWAEKNDFCGETSMKGNFLLSVLASIAFVATSAVAGISGGASQTAKNDQLLLVGPVEAIKERESIVVVLGQKLPLRSVGRVEVGETVAVFGAVRADGTITVARVQHEGLYVPGATSVLLTGTVQKINSLTGRAIVGGVSVDTTALTSIDQTRTIAVGTVVQVAGTQPAFGGLILVQGISGGAVQGISGGAVQGISGGAVQGISGGAVQGISGGAVQGISGGAVQGISGGAVQGISGGAVQGISGGAVQGISGGAKSAS